MQAKYPGFAAAEAARHGAAEAERAEWARQDAIVAEREAASIERAKARDEAFKARNVAAYWDGVRAWRQYFAGMGPKPSTPYPAGCRPCGPSTGF